MTAVPAYDLKLDELHVALGYACIGIEGEAVPPSDAVKKAMSSVPAPKSSGKAVQGSAAPKKEEKKNEKKKVND